MSLSNSRLSYEDCYEVMEKALESADGVRVGFDDQDNASYFRMRMNHARTLDRRFNGERYEGADPRRQRSEYDALSIRLRRIGDTFWVYIAKKQKPLVIEEIKEEEEGETVKPIREVITHRRF